MKFDVTYQGRVYAAGSANAALYAFRDGGFYGVLASAVVDEEGLQNSFRVALTGYSETSKKGSVGWQTKSGDWIILSEGWQLVGTAPVAQYSQTQAQALVNRIIKANQTIISNNLICARYANKLSEDQRAQVRALQSRLQMRNSALQAEGVTTDVRTSYPAGYAELSAYLDALMSGEQIGVATWVVIVIAATVIAAAATAAYYWYKSMADEAEKDVKFSKELTRVLTSKLTEEEYQQLLQETKGIATKSRIKQLCSDSWTTIKTLGILLVGGFIAYDVIKYYMKNPQQ